MRLSFDPVSRIRACTASERCRWGRPSYDDRCDEHEAILTAVVACDSEAARSLMLEHMRRDHGRARARCLRVPEPLTRGAHGGGVSRARDAAVAGSMIDAS